MRILIILLSVVVATTSALVAAHSVQAGSAGHLQLVRGALPLQWQNASESGADLLTQIETVETEPLMATPAPPPASSSAGEAPALGEPFSLHVGETANVAEADFQITLRSVAEGSGCLTENDCSLMLAEGDLLLEQGDQRELLSFNASFRPEQPFAYEFAGYVVQMTAMKQDREGQAVATFIVQKATATVEIPEPEYVERCPIFSRFDAAAILQEDVEKQAVTNLIFGPIAPDATEVQGMCGYVTLAFSGDEPDDELIPHLATEVEADRAMAATVVSADETTLLLQLAYLLSAAAPEADPDDLVRLQSELAAGLYENVISDLAAMAKEIPSFTVSPIEGIGDEGVWLWQQLYNGYFALLVTRYDDRFHVVIARLNADVEELTVLDYAVMIARRLDTRSTRTTTAPTDNPEIPPVITAGCDLLTLEEAAAILGEPAHEPVAVEGEEGSCLYVPESEEALTSEEAAYLQPEYGIITQLVTGDTVVEQVTSLAEELRAYSPNDNDDLFLQVRSRLATGNLEDALALLPQLAEGADNWIVEEVTTAGEGVIWLWFTDGDYAYGGLLAAGDDGTLRLILASLPPDRDTEEVRNVLVSIAERWTE